MGFWILFELFSYSNSWILRDCGVLLISDSGIFVMGFDRLVEFRDLSGLLQGLCLRTLVTLVRARVLGLESGILDPL